MRHLVKGRNLTRTSSHKKALMKNLATSLFEHKSIVTTEAKAKELRPYAEKLITKARVALQREKTGTLPEGQKIDIHSRRIVGRFIKNKAVLQELFDTIAPATAERNGGYTRIIKLGFRRGDASREAMIQLVDFGAPQDGAISSKKRKPVAKKKAAKPAVAKAPTAPVVEAPVEPTPAPVEEVVNETAPIIEDVVATNEANEVINDAEAANDAPAEEEKA